MDYKKAYEETFEQLYLMRVRLQEYEISEDHLYKAIGLQESAILSLNKSIESATGERKQRAEELMNKLVYVYTKIGAFYAEKIKYQLKCKDLEASFLIAADKIKEMEKEVDALRKIDDL